MSTRNKRFEEFTPAEVTALAERAYSYLNDHLPWSQFAEAGRLTVALPPRYEVEIRRPKAGERYLLNNEIALAVDDWSYPRPVIVKEITD